MTTNEPSCKSEQGLQSLPSPKINSKDISDGASDGVLRSSPDITKRETETSMLEKEQQLGNLWEQDMITKLLIPGPKLNNEDFLGTFCDPSFGLTQKQCQTVFDELKSTGFAGEDDTFSTQTFLQLLRQLHLSDIHTFNRDIKQFKATLRAIDASMKEREKKSPIQNFAAKCLLKYMYTKTDDFLVEMNILKNSRAPGNAENPSLNDSIRTLQRTWAAMLVPEYHLDRIQAEALVNKCIRNMQIELENDLSELRRLKLEAERKAVDKSTEEALRKRLESMTPEEAQALGLVGSKHGIGSQNVVAVRYVYADGTPVDNPAHLPEGAHIAEAAANANLHATAQLAAAAAKQAEAQALAVAGNMALATEMQARFSHAKGDPHAAQKSVAELQDYYRQQRIQMEQQFRTAEQMKGKTMGSGTEKCKVPEQYPNHHTVAEQCASYSKGGLQNEAHRQYMSFHLQQSQNQDRICIQQNTLQATTGHKMGTVEGVFSSPTKPNSSMIPVRMSSLPQTTTANGFPLQPSHCSGNVVARDSGTVASLQGQGMWKRNDGTEKEFFRRSRCPSVRSTGTKETPQRSLSLSNPLRSAGKLLQALGIWKSEGDDESEPKGQSDAENQKEQKLDQSNAQTVAAAPTHQEEDVTTTCLRNIQSSVNATFHMGDKPVVALDAQVHELQQHLQQQVHQAFLQQVREMRDCGTIGANEMVSSARNTASRITVKSLAEVPPVQLGRQQVVGVESINAQLNALSPQQLQQYARQYGTYSTPEAAAAAFGGVPLPGVGALQNRGQVASTTGTQLVKRTAVQEQQFLGTIEQVAAMKQRAFALRRDQGGKEVTNILC